MERNIFQQLQAIEQQLLAKKAIQVHIHISLSPGSPGLSESDVNQLMNDVDSVCNETIPTEHWPKWYVPAKPVKSGHMKYIAYYRRDDKNKGTTFHVDGTSFTFTNWYNVNAMEVPEQEAKARCQNESEFWEQFRTREQDLFSLRAAEVEKPECGFVVLKFCYDRPNRIGIWAYKTSKEFSNGRLAYTVVDDVSKCNVVPSPGRWAYVGDHR